MDDGDGSLKMTSGKLHDLRDAKRLSGADIEALIRNLAPRFVPKANLVRGLVDKGELFVIPEGQVFDLRLISAALLSLVVGDVNLYDPYTRKRQVAEIKKACRGLGVSYEDVLRLSEHEMQIRRKLRLRE